jgi:hypothetical protein
MLLDYLRRWVSAVNSGEEATADESQGEEHIGGEEHGPKSWLFQHPGGYGLKACQSPAQQPAKDGQNRRHYQANEDLQAQGQVVQRHRGFHFRMRPRPSTG